MVNDRRGRPARWRRALAWIGAWALVLAAASVLPTWAAIALAIAVFAGQVLAAPGRGTCHLPEDRRRGVIRSVRPNGR